MKYYYIYALRSDDMYGRSMRIKVEKGINIEIGEDEWGYWDLSCLTIGANEDIKHKLDSEIELIISFTVK